MNRLSCHVVKHPENYQIEGGISYFSGVTAQTVGAEKFCVTHYIVAPLGHVGAHLHEHHESAVFVISGELDASWGTRLEESAVLGPGDFIFIPAGVPHRLVNGDDERVAETIVVRSDPEETESVVLLPELESRASIRRQS